MKDNNIIIFSDGSARGNPGQGGWGAIVCADEKVIELGGREVYTTNNRMELTAAINALAYIDKDPSQIKSQFDGERIILNTDSAYVVNGITKWIYGWQKNNWKTSEKEPVVNKDLWEELIKVVGINPSQIKSQFDGARKIKWNQIGGHIGVPGNERCDEIATSFADNVAVKLFNGKASAYKYDLSDTKGSGVKKKSKTQNKLPAYSYLSLVHGILKIDKTWAECEKRVKGVKGDVRFKKAVSEEDEKQIIKNWNKKN